MDYDPSAELYEICSLALDEASTRPLTELEVNALRFAAAIERQPAASNSGKPQPDLI